ncbi:MAG: cyclic nucleotide-binding domain-containing protein [Verrucomicrobiota bacterium]
METEKELTFARDEIIFSQDTRPDGVYIVRDGLVEVFHTIDQDGELKDVELGRVGPRGIFGEMGIIDHQPRSASARALGPTTVIFISKEDFNKHLSDLPPWIAVLIKTFVSRLRESNQRLFEALENGPDGAGHLHIQPHDDMIIGEVDESGSHSSK